MSNFITKIEHEEFALPPDFVYDPDLLASYEDQVKDAIQNAKYQNAPLPSLEYISKADVRPVFNPTNAPPDEIYARNRFPRELGEKWRVRSEWAQGSEQVKMWRVVDRAKLRDGTALVSSRILQTNSLGDVEGFATNLHMLSHDVQRMADPDNTTPFISFSTDPNDLARTVILKYGFGIKQGQDAVIVEVTVDPDRVITENKNKSDEVLLLGGVAPEEYGVAYEITDFVNEVVGPEETILIGSSSVQRDKALGHWALIAPHSKNDQSSA